MRIDIYTIERSTEYFFTMREVREYLSSIDEEGMRYVYGYSTRKVIRLERPDRVWEAIHIRHPRSGKHGVKIRDITEMYHL